MPFNSLMTEFFEDSNFKELIQHLFAHINKQAENTLIIESGFTLDQTMHLYINFHRLALTRRSPYTVFPEWSAKKIAVMNLKNNNEECFKWAVMAALRHKVIEHNPKRFSLL